MGDGGQEEGWVVCRIFKKKNHLKTLDSPLASSISGEGRRSHHMYDTCDEGALEQILQQMGRSCKEENYEANYNNYGRFTRPFDTGFNNNNNNGGYHDRYMKLPNLESPKSTSMESQQNNNENNNGYHPIIQEEMRTENEGSFNDHHNMVNVNPLEASSSSISSMGGGLTNWVALDRLVASQLNGQTEASRQLACFNDPTMGYCTSDHDLQFPTLRSSSSTRARATTAISTTTATTTTTDVAASYLSPTQDYTCEIDLWNFARSTSSLLSSSEPLCHVSNTSV